MDLKELLGEDLYKQVLEKVGDKKIDVVSDGNWIPKEKFDSVNSEKNEYKRQVNERDTQLSKLGEQVKGNEKISEQLATLQNENKVSKEKYEAELKQLRFDTALDKALVNGKAKNSKAVRALLNLEKIEVDGENIKGLDDQLKTLSESDPYLFGEGIESKPSVGGLGNFPKPTQTPKESNFGAELAKKNTTTAMENPYFK